MQQWNAQHGIVALTLVLLVETGTELNENGKANCQVQGKTTCVRLKEWNKLKKEMAVCGFNESTCIACE